MRVSVVVWTASLRYDDGKRLKGIGTRASKSRLTPVQCERNSSRMPFDVPKGRQEGVSCFFGEKEGEGRERRWLRFLTRLSDWEVVVDDLEENGRID
jgi:hypothetical protein